MSAFSAHDSFTQDFVMMFRTMQDFQAQVSRDDQELYIVKMSLYYEPGAKKHEYLIFHLRAIPRHGKFHLDSTDYYLRLDRRAHIETDSSRRAATQSSLLSSSAVVANDDIAITRQLENNPNFGKADAVLRCEAIYPAASGLRLHHLISTVTQIRQQARLRNYTLFWANCWAFARTIFHKLAQHNWPPGTRPNVLMAQDDGTMATGDLDAFLTKLMTEDVLLLVGFGIGALGGIPAASTGYTAGLSAAAWAMGQAGLAGGALGGPVGAAAGLLVGGVAFCSTAFVGGMGGAIVNDVYQSRFFRNWWTLLSNINLDIRSDVLTRF